MINQIEPDADATKSIKFNFRHSKGEGAVLTIAVNDRLPVDLFFEDTNHGNYYQYTMNEEITELFIHYLRTGENCSNALDNLADK
jgi:hypothetical protein